MGNRTDDALNLARPKHRDPARIERIVAKLALVWAKAPDLRPGRWMPSSHRAGLPR